MTSPSSNGSKAGVKEAAVRALRVEAPGRFGIIDISMPEPRPDEVLVAVGAAGICGSDLHILDGNFPPTPFPITTGHEGAGTVVAVGSAVSDLHEGARVAINPSLSCGLCRFCLDHRENLCDRWASIGGTRDGSFAEFVAVPASSAYRIPDHVSFEAAALAEPVACAIHGMDRLQMRPGDSVLIIGAGTAGLILAQLTRHAGAGLVSLVNRSHERLQAAEQMDFTSLGSSIADVATAAPGGFDVVIDATGAPDMIEAGIAQCGKGGTFMIYGMAAHNAKVEIEPLHLFSKEVSIVSSLAILASYERAVAMIANGVIDTQLMITHRYSLERFGDAATALREGVGIKHQIIPSLSQP